MKTCFAICVGKLLSGLGINASTVQVSSLTLTLCRDFANELHVDFDLCSTCLAAQPLNIGSHSRSHSLFAIEEAGGLWVHTDFAGGSIPEVAEPSATEGPPELPNTSPPPSGSDTQGERTPPIAKLAVHHATCDLCDCTIKGDRFVSTQTSSIECCSHTAVEMLRLPRFRYVRFLLCDRTLSTPESQLCSTA